jgi:hypothetical protein
MKKKILLILSLIAVLTSYVHAQVEATTGKVTFLRINRVGGKYGPPNDQIDAEVIFKMSTKPDNAFGFQLRKDNDQLTHQAMLLLLKEAFNSDRSISIEYTKDGTKKNLMVIRVFVEK